LRDDPGMIDVIKVWTAHTSDDDRGRDSELIGVYPAEGLAKEAARKRGFYGSDGNVAERTAIWVNGEHLYLLDRTTPYPVGMGIDLIRAKAAKKTAALAKLTEEEINLLGLKGVK